MYYAGHGIEVDGTNYLIPVDAVLERDVDVDDEAVSVDRVMRALDPVKRLRVVILDACRDSPFTRTMKRTMRNPSTDRGLAKVEPASSDTLISFSAKAGSTAIDGDGPNSPFAAALVRHLTTPGLDLRIAFGRIRDDVMKATSNRQEPFVYGSLGGSLVSLVPAPQPTVAAPLASPPTAADNVADARRDYEFVERMGTKEAWTEFLQLHPSGLYANLAHAQLAKLLEVEKAAAEKAAEEQARIVAQGALAKADTGHGNTVTTQQATAKRVALVIGNGAYKNAAHLPNPSHDAQDVAAALKRIGFETIVGFDLDRAGMDDYAVRFARAAREADVALFYYSGHAMQFAGINYLMPIDARLVDEADLRRLSRVDDIVADLQQAKNLRILVLDSCRNNPLAEELKRSIGRSRAVTISRGLARLETPQGMIVAYSTQPGRTAEDGIGRNSPYTAAFLKYIERQEEIGTVFRRVSADVYEATRHAQLPELSLSLIGEFYLKARHGSGPCFRLRPHPPGYCRLLGPSDK